MAARKEIKNRPELSPGANQLVLKELGTYRSQVEEAFQADCLAYVGPIAFGADDVIRTAIEDIGKRRRKLLFILETEGGYAEVAKRIADTARHHYRRVEFLVAGQALSAGTILVMSGDAIHMDYYSVLGPIDPQTETDDGALAPALGYLLRYERLLEKGNGGKLTTTEMHVLLNFDQARLYAYEQARNLSIELLKEWLVKYKFRSWKRTQTRRLTVTKTMRKERAEDIAKKLNNVEKWNSHGMGINRRQLWRELKLKTDDFGEDRKLHGTVRCYHGLLIDFMIKMGVRSAIHTREGLQFALPASR